jgi:hypothetical protein
MEVSVASKEHRFATQVKSEIYCCYLLISRFFAIDNADFSQNEK